MLEDSYLYLFNNLELLIDVVSSDRLITWQHEQACNEFDKVTLELPVSYAIDDVCYVGFFDDAQDFKLFKIEDRKLGHTLYLEGIDKAESDLRTVAIIKDKRPQNVTADQALSVALEETGYQVGSVSSLPQLASLTYYYISPREALVKIVEAFQCEFRVRYVFRDNKVIGRYIDLAKRFGKASGKQFVHGDNALEVVQEVSSAHVVTALIGRGKGEELDSGDYGRRIEFTDIIWSRAKGDPIDKPAGQNYLLLDSARQKFGLSQNGRLLHRWGVFVDESIEDKAILLRRTWEELQRLSFPAYVYKANVIHLGNEAKLGDRVVIIHEIGGIAVEARLIKVVRDKLSPDKSTVEIGDYESLKAYQSRDSPNQRLKQAIDEQMSRYAQDLQAFYGRIEDEKERRNAEIDERFRLAQLDFDNYKVLAETKVEEVKSEITDKIDTQIKPLATEAKHLADRAVSDLERQGQELERTKADLGVVRRSAESAIQTAQRVKTEAITASSQQLDEAKRTLSTQIQATQGQIADAKRELLADAQTRQNSLNSRLTTVQELANGTRTRVSELKATVDQTTGKVQAVERRTKTVEDGLTGLTRRFEAIRVGGRNYFLNSSLSTASPYTKLTIHPDFEKHVKGKSFIISVEVEGTDITGSNRGRFGISLSVRRGNTSVRDYLEVWETGTGTVAKKRLFKAFDWREDWTDLNAGLYIQTDGHLTVGYPMLEIGEVPSDYRPAEEDFRSELATYKQGVDQNLAELTRTTQTIDGKVETYKSTFEQTTERFRQSLTTLETYKNDEAVRASRYFEASKTETAKQLTALRQVISNDYVAKSTYEENAREVIRRFEGLRTGENLLLNSSFEMDLEHWTNNGAVLRDGCIVFEGQLNTTKHLYQPITDLVKADAYNQVYTVGVAIKADNIVLGATNPYLHVYVEGRHSDNQWFGGTYIERPSFSELNNQGWTRLYTTFTLNVSRAAIRYCNIHLYVRDFTGTISAKQIMLSRSTIKQEWSPHPKDSEARLAGFKQTVEGQFNTVTEALNDKVSTTTFNQTADDIRGLVSTLDGQVMKSNQFRIDENGLVLQAGRTVNGRTLVSMFTQDPENVSIIARQLRVKADMIVDGAITGRHLATQSIETGHMKAGSITTPLLSTGAVTADKVTMNQAMVDKLLTNDLLTQTLTARQAFITSIQAIDFSAERIKSGILAAKNGAMALNLDKAVIDFRNNAMINFHSANNALVRKKGTHTAFVHFEDARDVNDSIYAAIGVTSSGDGVNSRSSGRFAGARFFRSASGYAHDGGSDYVEIFGDTIYFKDAFDQNRGFKMRPTHMGGMLDLNDLYGAVLALKRVWIHARNSGYSFGHSSFGTALEKELSRMAI